MKTPEKLIAHLKLSGEEDHQEAAELISQLLIMLKEKEIELRRLQSEMDVKMSWAREKLRCSNLLK